MPSREITKLTDSFPALRNDPALMLEVFQENLGGETIGSRDLDNIKIPSGGGTSWEVPSIDGGIAAKTIEGVVVQHGLRRAYWASRKVTNQPPQCRSDNSRDAIGDPGSNLGPNRDGVGACLECPLAEFGTGVDENGQANNSQACKQMRQVFFLMSDGLLPRVVTLPPTSLAVSRTTAFPTITPSSSCPSRSRAAASTLTASRAGSWYGSSPTTSSRSSTRTAPRSCRCSPLDPSPAQITPAAAPSGSKPSDGVAPRPRARRAS
jgi:hypothetical protein